MKTEEKINKKISEGLDLISNWLKTGMPLDFNSKLDGINSELRKLKAQQKSEQELSATVKRIYEAFVNVDKSERVFALSNFEFEPLSKEEIIQKIKEHQEKIKENEAKQKTKEFTIQGTFKGDKFPNLLSIESKLSELGVYDAVNYSINHVELSCSNQIR